MISELPLELHVVEIPQPYQTVLRNSLDTDARWVAYQAAHLDASSYGSKYCIIFSPENRENIDIHAILQE